MKKILICSALLLSLFFIRNSIAKEKVFTVFIDPGHGGIDQGALGELMHESEINLNVSLNLKERLESLGYKVYMTRYGDYDLASDDSENRKKEDIYKRVDLINDSDCDIYISIHTNAIESTQWSGAQVFYKENEDNMEIATSIQKNMYEVLQNTDRTEKTITGKYLVDNTLKSGVLVELGFLSNETERALLETKEYQSILSYAILIGLLEYATNENML